MASRPISSTSGSSRPDMKVRAFSSGSGHTLSSSPPTLSPTSPLSPSTTHASSPSNKEHHLSLPFHFSRSRSKSPRPPPPTDLSIPSSTTLKHSQTQPLSRHSSSQAHPPTQRHASDGVLITKSATSPTATSPTSPDSARRDSWIQKKPRYVGPAPGGYGRHGDDWLFGGISFRETTKGIITRNSRRTDDDRDRER